MRGFLAAVFAGQVGREKRSTDAAFSSRAGDGLKEPAWKSFMVLLQVITALGSARPLVLSTPTGWSDVGSFRDHESRRRIRVVLKGNIVAGYCTIRESSIRRWPVSSVSTPSWTVSQRGDGDEPAVECIPAASS